MDFGLSEEQELLQRSAHDFVTRECPTSFVREMARSEDGFSRALHDKMAGMGWTGLIIPEAFGGVGMGMLDLAVLSEELGRALVPGPFFSSSVLAALALVNSPASGPKKEWLPRIAAGEAIGTLALLEESDRLDGDGISLRCTKTRTGFRLNGTKMFVTDAQVADFLIVLARNRGEGEEGLGLYLVPRDTKGLTIQPLLDIDQTRRPYEVGFRNVDLPASARIADGSKAWRIVSRVVDAACVVLAADSLGGSQRSIELAVEYSKVREQFGKPIGSFQAVKHICAEMVSEVEPARSLVWYAGYAFDNEPRNAARAVSMAKARLSDVYCRTTNRAVQVHGGIGFTWEHDMHLWFKRARWNAAAFGDAAYHRERLAQLAGW